jgi:hypothetical protein
MEEKNRKKKQLKFFSREQIKFIIEQLCAQMLAHVQALWQTKVQAA